MHLLGVVLAGPEEWHAVAAWIVGAIRAAGPKPEYCANLGRILFRREQWAQAAACFRQSIAGDPLGPGVTFQLGRTLLLLGRPDEARLAFEQVTALAPRFAEAHYNHLGVLWTIQEKFDPWASRAGDIGIPPSHRGAPELCRSTLEPRTCAAADGRVD